MRLFILLTLFVSITTLSHAGGAIEQRMQAVRQQRQMQQQAIAQQRAAQEAAMRRGVAQRTVAQQRAYQQAVVQQQAAAAVSMRQQMAAQQNAAYRNALQNKIAQRMGEEQKFAYQQMQSQQAAINESVERHLKALNTDVGQPYIPAKVDEVLTLEEIWKRFEVSSELWTSMMDVEPKQFTVAKYIEEYRMQGIGIQKSPYHYVQLIDSMSMENASLLKNPFKDIVRIVAIMEYDFDNGRDKDMMIKQMLGESGYKANKARIGK